MILAFCNIGSPTVLQLFNEGKNLVAEEREEREDDFQKKTQNLLQDIDTFLEKNTSSLPDLTKIYFISGPGDFTPVRIGSLVANALSQELKIPLFPVLYTDFKQQNFDFHPFLSSVFTAAEGFVQPIFKDHLRVG